MENLHEVNIEDFKTLDPKKYTMSVNGNLPSEIDDFDHVAVEIL